MRLVGLFIIVALSFLSQAGAQNVFTTKTGEKYHKEACRYLKYSKKEISLDDAIARGYNACQVCKPSGEKTAHQNEVLSLNISAHEETPKKNTTSTQCTGITKSGTRCKRKTKNGTGKCYQH